MSPRLKSIVEHRSRLRPRTAGVSPAQQVIGLVEVFQYRQVLGWVSTDPADLPVRVTLHVNDLEVAATWAVDPSSHNTEGEVRGFRFALADIWQYCRTTDHISVRVGGRPLPIHAKGTYKRPADDGVKSLETLRKRLKEGYLFSQWGHLQLSKRLDEQWQASVVGLYERMRQVVEDSFGYQPFVIYGTLLGVVREGDFIGHDVDFDAAYLSRHRNGPDAAAELRDVAFALIDAGFGVQGKATALHVHDPEDPRTKIDLFHLYFGEDDRLAVPFGVAGTSKVLRETWTEPQPAELGGRTVLVPPHPEQLVEHLYGADWRTPIAGFNWDRARVSRAEEGWLPDAYREEVYWANFYAHTELEGGSTFFDAVSQRPDLPSTVIDIGCGDGRDAFAFARSGRTVVGLDRSHVGIRHATKHAAESGLAEVLSFVAGDVSDGPVMAEVFGRAHDLAQGQPVVYYLRFFLHSIPEETQDALLASIAESAREGDLFAAEFRTDKDRDATKVYGGHYRRYQSADDFSHALQERWGFTVLEEQESTGLSPYGAEDPVLYRVVARR